MKDMDKWKTLKHNGPLFAVDYEHKGFNVVVNGNSYKLDKDSEELAYAWAQKHATVYVTDKVFQKNFYKDFTSKLPENVLNSTKNSKFPEDWNFSEFIDYIEKIKKDKKEATKEQRKEEKDGREQKKERYGFATLDGNTVELGNYAVEPPGIFMGRGQHPLRGRWKGRIFPEDVTINLSEGSEVPVHPEGHAWKSVTPNRKALWTAMWYEKLTGAQKRILFSVTSFVRQNSDKKKFDKAIQLANNWQKVDDFISKKLTSQDKHTRELATVCHIISKLSIRVGDEKGEDTADTVGATSLRFEHLSFDGLNVTLDFLGKDSINYHKTVNDFNINAIRNLKEFTTGKKKGDSVFANITSKDVSDFLGLIIPGLTAKQFRTATGSTLLANQLKAKKIDKDLKVNKKLEAFTEANIEVAIKLNHQNAVSEAYENSLKNMKSRLKEMKARLKDVQNNSEKELNQAKDTMENRVSYAKNRWSGTKQNDAIKRAKQTYKKTKEKFEKRADSLKERIDNLKSKINIKEKTKGVALGTSVGNYSSPRIIYSWCKDNEVPIERIYNKSLLKKYDWAADTEKDYYKKYPKVDK